MTMRQIKSTVSYKVPSWNFCNSDNLSVHGDLTSQTCRFCIKDKTGHRCLLYDEMLNTKGEFIQKVRECCKATAGFESVVDEVPPGPTIPPRDLMKQTIELYSKTMNELIGQGYPRAMAEQAAKKYILEGK